MIYIKAIPASSDRSVYVLTVEQIIARTVGLVDENWHGPGIPFRGAGAPTNEPQPLSLYSAVSEKPKLTADALAFTYRSEVTECRADEAVGRGEEELEREARKAPGEIIETVPHGIVKVPTLKEVVNHVCLVTGVDLTPDLEPHKEDSNTSR